MRLSIIIALVFLLPGPTPLMAQQSPYSGMENRDIKALSKKQVEGYLSGRGMRLALSAELNGYPGPKHVLELDTRLGLSESQRERVQQVFASMQSEAIAMGEEIVAAEAALDSQFSDGTINSEQLLDLTRDIGLLKGRLRAVHLRAHLETKALLSAEQIQKYAELRGYHHGGH